MIEGIITKEIELEIVNEIKTLEEIKAKYNKNKKQK